MRTFVWTLAPLLAALACAPALGAVLRESPTAVADSVSGAYVRDLGRAGADVRVDLALVFAYRDQAALDRLVEAQGDPDSPLFRRFLATGQFRAAFAPTPETYGRVVGSLQRAGFSITHAFPNRTIVDASAPAPVAERYFQTEIHRVRVGGASVRYANVRPAFLPQELSGVVAAVVGLDNVEWFHTTHRDRVARPLQALVRQQTAIGQPLLGPNGNFGPLAFAQGYDMPVQHQIPGAPPGTTYDGSGRTAAVEMAGNPTEADLAMFLSYFNITRTGTTTRIPVDGGVQGSGSEGTNFEATLDYEGIVGEAPGADVDIYEFPDLSNKSVVDGFNAAVSDNTADTINASLADCETAQLLVPKAIARVFEQGVAQGQTFHASSGDGGTLTYGCYEKPSVNTPADTPFSVAIGGTSLYVDDGGKYLGETYWHDADGGAGSGGVSVIFKLPSFQRDVPNITPGGRNVPDLSFHGDWDRGEDVVFEGKWQSNAGTSLSSPLFGACAVEVVQILGQRLGNATATLYRRWLKLGYGAGNGTLTGGPLYAHDISAGEPYSYLIPRVGYDLATGIGSLDCFVGGPALL